MRRTAADPYNKSMATPEVYMRNTFLSASFSISSAALPMRESPMVLRIWIGFSVFYIRAGHELNILGCASDVEDARGIENLVPF